MDAAQIPDVEFTQIPKDGQLYPRNLQNNADVMLAGEVRESGYDEIRVEVFRNGVLWNDVGQNLQYANGIAPFSLNTTIFAEFSDYRFVVYVMANGMRTDVTQRKQIVCGDVLLIQGQSNAVAWDSYQEGKANEFQSSWVRSYGTGSIWPSQVEFNRSWYLADGETGNEPGSIGIWGLRMARLLSDQFQIPIAVLNGAVGGTPIFYHLRNDSDPNDLSTNYGRLLYRCEQANLVQHVRAILWYQGESDEDRVVLYEQHFDDLYSAWKQDYPNLEQIYLLQVRKGCGNPSLPLRDLQRRLQDIYADVSVMSTTAAVAHDGCHFYFRGYRDLGNRMARLLGRDLYGAPQLPNVDAPNIVSAQYATANQRWVVLTFDPPSTTLRWQPGSEDMFILDEGRSVLDGFAVGNQLILQLNQPGLATHISFDGRSGDGNWFYNENGIGALTFYQIPIQ